MRALSQGRFQLYSARSIYSHTLALVFLLSTFVFAFVCCCFCYFFFWQITLIKRKLFLSVSVKWGQWQHNFCLGLVCQLTIRLFLTLSAPPRNVRNNLYLEDSNSSTKW